MLPAPTNTKVKITKIKSVLGGTISIYKIKAPVKYSPDSQTQ
jgi:hypothetical protein